MLCLFNYIYTVYGYQLRNNMEMIWIKSHSIELLPLYNLQLPLTITYMENIDNGKLVINKAPKNLLVLIDFVWLFDKCIAGRHNQIWHN